MYIAILLLHNIFSTVNKLLLFFFLLFSHIYSTVNFDWICNFPTILILQSLVEITHKNGDETWWIHLHVCYGNSHNQRSTYCSKSSTVVSHKPLRGFIASHSFLFFLLHIDSKEITGGQVLNCWMKKTKPNKWMDQCCDQESGKWPFSELLKKGGKNVARHRIHTSTQRWAEC